jgi:hypothetical protein
MDEETVTYDLTQEGLPEVQEVDDPRINESLNDTDVKFQGMRILKWPLYLRLII